MKKAGLGGGMRLTKQAHMLRNAFPIYRRPRHDLNLVSALQRGREYSKTITINGSPVFHGISKISLYPALLCHSATTSVLCNGNQRLDINQLERVRALQHDL